MQGSEPHDRQRPSVLCALGVPVRLGNFRAANKVWRLDAFHFPEFGGYALETRRGDEHILILLLLPQVPTFALLS
jgi:hypothetical protein